MQTRPNIIVVTTHDSGRNFGCYGVPQVDSVNIDGLAAEGVKLSQCFAAVPICCASRASMLTGRYPQSHGLMDLCFAPFDWALHENERHLSHIMREAGYRTCLFGMQHEAKDIARLAFDHITPGGPNGKMGNAFGIVEKLGDFLRSDEAKRQPFYAQVGFFESHTPFDFGGSTPDESRGVYVPPYLNRDEVAVRTCAALQGAIRQADRAVGELMRHLHDTALEENTLLVFTTDHGVELPRAKWFCYDPGIEIAMIMRWPTGGLTGGRSLDWLVSNVDFVPTVLELAGIPPPAGVQGISFASGVRGENANPTRDAVYVMYHKTSSRALRTRTHKYIRSFDAVTDFSRVPVSIENVLARRPIRTVELYDLESDPSEYTNLAGASQCAALQREFDGKLWRWMESVSDPLLAGPVRTPSYENSARDYREWSKSER